MERFCNITPRFKLHACDRQYVLHLSLKITQVLFDVNSCVRRGKNFIAADCHQFRCEHLFGFIVERDYENNKFLRSGEL